MLKQTLKILFSTLLIFAFVLPGTVIAEDTATSLETVTEPALRCTLIKKSILKCNDITLDENVDVLDFCREKSTAIESVSSSTTTNEYGIPESIISQVKFRGIDVSRHQYDIDWNAVKADGVDFAIIRAGFGNDPKQKDPYFEKNYAEAKSAGIAVGAYWYSYADSVDDAVREADLFMSVIQGKQFEYPIFFDIEDNSQQKLGSALLTDMTIAFLMRVASSGYYIGLYTNPNWITYFLEKDRLGDYDKWLAHWTSEPMFGPEFGGDVAVCK